MYRDTFAVERPNVLICAGLDPSGGAGFLADARVVHALGGRPCGVVTTLTIQNTLGMSGGVPVANELLGEQLDALLSDVEIRAVKIGMIGSGTNAAELARALAATAAPVVWDPVIYPSRGDIPRVDAWIVQAMIDLIPHVTLLTPNRAELEILVGTPIANAAEAIAAGQRILAKLGVAVLVKGGHFGTDRSIDLVIEKSGTTEIAGPRIAGGEDTHGTGCALSSAIATHLALGLSLVEACRAAKTFVADRIAHAVAPGRGARAIV